MKKVRNSSATAAGTWRTAAVAAKDDTPGRSECRMSVLVLSDQQVNMSTSLLLKGPLGGGEHK